MTNVFIDPRRNDATIGEIGSFAPERECRPEIQRHKNESNATHNNVDIDIAEIAEILWIPTQDVGANIAEGWITGQRDQPTKSCVLNRKNHVAKSLGFDDVANEEIGCINEKYQTECERKVVEENITRNKAKRSQISIVGDIHKVIESEDGHNRDEIEFDEKKKEGNSFFRGERKLCLHCTQKKAQDFFYAKKSYTQTFFFKQEIFFEYQGIKTIQTQKTEESFLNKKIMTITLEEVYIEGSIGIEKNTAPIQYPSEGNKSESFFEHRVVVNDMCFVLLFLLRYQDRDRV
jgi:hypothetical protein